MKFYTAEEVSRVITEDLLLPTHEYTDEEFSESDDDVDTVPMPCPLDEREELHLPEQIIGDTSLFAVNITSDVSNQEQQSQIDDGQAAQSASSCGSSVVVENNQYNQNRHWKNKSKNANNAGEFKAPEGPISNHFTNCTSPIDTFLKHLDTEITDNILYQSNFHITQKSSRAKPIDQREFIGFLGINTLMGYHKSPSWTRFWSNEPDLCVPFDSTVMPRNRFAEILSHLHVNDNLLMPRDNTDRLYKLRPLMESLNNRYVKLCNISK